MRGAVGLLARGAGTGGDGAGRDGSTGFDRAAWDAVEFEQIDGTTRRAYLPVVTLTKDSDD